MLPFLLFAVKHPIGPLFGQSRGTPVNAAALILLLGATSMITFPTAPLLDQRANEQTETPTKPGQTMIIGALILLRRQPGTTSMSTFPTAPASSAA